MNLLKDVFISYGRADSREFAQHLCHRLTEAGYTVWFDYNDIPPGKDYQLRINDGIAKADNFLFIISPHATNSAYCRKEIDLAIALNKRLVPIMHVEQISKETWQQRHPHSSEADWQAYQATGKHSCFTHLHPELAKINWNQVSFQSGINDFEQSFQSLVGLFEQQRDVVHQHTVLLTRAMTWEQQHRQTPVLLVGDDCRQGIDWLQARFQDRQSPGQPTDLQCEFIAESLKSAKNLMTQVFLAYAETDRAVMEPVRRSLWRAGITVWTNTTDLQPGADFPQAILQGIEQADNLVYLLSPASLESSYCQRELSYAIALNKRIIPILVSPVEAATCPPELSDLHYIDLTGNPQVGDYQADESELLRILQTDDEYYQTHKLLLVQALKWKQQHRNPSILLRGYNLRQADIWLKTAQTRSQHLPTPLQADLIEESLRQPPPSSLDVFISYSRADADFARQLNDTLQIYGKLTWFDQESIANASADFKTEIRRGIEVSNNFVFILSPRSVQSRYCAEEVEYAAKLNKRFITILHQPIDLEGLHPALAQVQWLDFAQAERDFWEDFNQLVRVLETDREYVQSHTKWSQQAIEWQQLQQSPDLLLRGSEFAIAEAWLQAAIKEHKQPAPTELQVNYIEASQAAIAAEVRQEQRQRVILRSLLGIMTTVALVAAGTGVWASHSRRQAIKSEIQALAASSEAQFITGQSFDALVTALKAEDRLRSAHWLAHDRPLHDRVTTALQQAVYLGREIHRLEDFERLVSAAKFSPDGQTLITVDEQQIKLWTPDGQRLKNADGLPIAPLEHAGQFNSVVFTADSRALMMSGWDPGLGQPSIQRWDLAGNALPTLSSETQWQWIAPSPNGQTIATSDGNSIRLWHPDGTLRTDLPNSAAVGWLSSLSELGQNGFSEDGQTLVVFESDRQLVRLWRLDGTYQEFVVPGELQYQALSPDGSRLIFSGDDQLQVYQPDGTQQVTLAQSQLPQNATLGTVVLSADGHIAASYTFNQANRGPFVRLWNPEGDLIAALDGHDAFISTMKFSPDGQLLATASYDKTVKLWRLDGTLVDDLPGHADWINSLDFRPDGAVLATGSYDATLRLWSVDVNLAKSTQVDQHFVNPDQTQFVTGMTNGPVKLWQADGSPIATLTEQNAGVVNANWSADGSTLVTTAQQAQVSYGPVQVWSADGQRQATLIEQTETTPKDTTSELVTRISSDGQRIITIAQTPETYGPARLWTQDGQLLATLVEQLPKAEGYTENHHYHNVIAFTGDGQAIVTQLEGMEGDGPVQLWNTDGGPITTLIAPMMRAEAVAEAAYVGRQVFSSESGGTLVTLPYTSETYGPVELWDSSGQKQATLVEAIAIADDEERSSTWIDVKLSPDGETISTVVRSPQNPGLVQLWDAQGQAIATLMAIEEMAEEDDINVLFTFSPTGDTFVTQKYSSTTYGPVQLWRQNGELIATLIEPMAKSEDEAQQAIDIRFSEDGQTLITTVPNGAVQRWQTETGTLINTVMPSLDSSNPWGLIVSPDETLLAVPIGAKTYEIWDVEGQRLRTIQGDGDATAPQFSADSQMFVVGNYDNRVRLWHRDQSSLITLGGHESPPTSLFFAPDSTQLASADNRQLILHQLDGLTDLDNLVQMGCERVATHILHSAEFGEGDRSLCQNVLSD
ncbi:MAG: TIR domain-containing protein [Cyanobacteria bacterium J06626_4]